MGKSVSKSTTTATQSSGIGLFSLLGVAFVVLKLCGVIAWSWWWVTAPFWGGFAIALGILLLVGIGALIVSWRS